MQIFCPIFQSNIPCSLKCSYSGSPGTFQFNTETYILYINAINLDNYIIYNLLIKGKKYQIIGISFKKYGIQENAKHKKLCCKNR